MSDDPTLRGEGQAIHVTETSFSVPDSDASTFGPDRSDVATYRGQAAAITTDDRSPHQWIDAEVRGPMFDYPYYRGRSPAIHVFGNMLDSFTPVVIPGCKCCEEQGVAGSGPEESLGECLVWSGYRGTRVLEASAMGGPTSVTSGPTFAGASALSGFWTSYDTVSGGSQGNREMERRTWLTFLVPQAATHVRITGTALASLITNDITSAGRPQATDATYDLGVVTIDPDAPPDWASVGTGLGGTAPLSSEEPQSSVPIDLTVSSFGASYDAGDGEDWKLLQLSFVLTSPDGIGRHTWFGAPGHADGDEIEVVPRFPDNPNWHRGGPGDYLDWSQGQSSVALDIVVEAFVSAPVPIAHGDCEDDCDPENSTPVGSQETIASAERGWSVTKNRTPDTTYTVASDFLSGLPRQTVVRIEDVNVIDNTGAETRAFVEHDAPVGATEARLRTRVYASGFAESGQVPPVDAAWAIYQGNWDVSTGGPTNTPRALAAGYDPPWDSIGPVLASGTVLSSRAAGTTIRAYTDVDVTIPVVDGKIKFVIAFNPTQSQVNAWDNNNPSPVVVAQPRYPDLPNPYRCDDRVLITTLAGGVNNSPGSYYTLDFYEVTGGGGCTECVECEDPDNPGVQIPDFTPGYMPIFRRQIGDPTTWLDAFICTFSSGAMVLDWHTRGAVQVWGGELIPWSGRTEASIFGSGSNLGDVQQAWAHWDQYLQICTGQSFNDLLAYLAEGRAVILQGDYDQFSLNERCQVDFEENHAVAVFPYQVADRLLVGDPICSNFKAFKISSLRAYAEDLGQAVFGTTSPQKIFFAVSRPWTP